MIIEGIGTQETVRVWHVNAGGKPTWRASIGKQQFIDHPTPEAAFVAAMAWARSGRTTMAKP